MGRAAYDNCFIKAEVLDSVHFKGELCSADECVYYLLLFVRSGDDCADAPLGKGDSHLDPNACQLRASRTASFPLTLLQEV